MKFPRPSSLLWLQYSALKYFDKIRAVKAKTAVPNLPALPTWQSLVSANANLFPADNDWSNTYWANDTSASAVANAAVAPDGTNTAARISDNSTTSVTARAKQFTISTENKRYRFSGFFKAETSKVFSLRSAGAVNVELVVNLETAEAVFRTASASPGESFKITKLANGWCHVSYIRNSVSGNNLVYNIRPAYASALTTGAPTNPTVGSILVWQPKFELLP